MAKIFPGKYAPRQSSIETRLAFYSEAMPNGCRIWRGYISPCGYGRVSWNNRGKLAHRVAWEIKHGSIPPQMAICHKCDVRACINVDHLFTGTVTDNNADRVAKGRSYRAYGTRHGLAKLTDGKVLEIRKDARSQRAIAKHYGVSQRLVWNIQNRRSWTHI